MISLRFLLSFFVNWAPVFKAEYIASSLCSIFSMVVSGGMFLRESKPASLNYYLLQLQFGKPAIV